MKKPAKIPLRYHATAAVWVSVFVLAIGVCWTLLAGEQANGPALALLQPPLANAAVVAVPPATVPPTTDAQYKSAERFQLTGVIGGQAGNGVALISLDGKPAQPFTIGTQVATGYVLHSVSEGRAMLAERMDLPVKLNLYLSVPRPVTAAALSGISAFALSAHTGLATQAAQQLAGGGSQNTEPPPRMDSRYRPMVSRRPIPH